MTPDLESAHAALKRWEREEETNRILGYEWDVAEALRWAVGEIEHLEGYKIAARDLNRDLTETARERDALAARIAELETNCIYDPEDGKIFVPDGHPELEKLRARITELETDLKQCREWLAEERAWRLRVDPAEAWRIPGVRALGCRSIDEWAQDEARRQLIAEGKIGSDAPVSWRVTEERVDAIESAVVYAREILTDGEKAVLRTMLEESRP